MITKLIKKCFWLQVMIFFSCFAEHGSAGNATGKTFFSHILPFNSSAGERTTVNNYLKPTDHCFFLSIIASYSKSCSNHKLSEYFLLNGRNILSVIGGADNFEFNSQSSYRRDIDAVNFDVTDDLFHSALELTLKSAIGSINFFGEQIFSYYDDGRPRWSMQLALPVMLLKHAIEGEERIIKKDPGEIFIYSATPSLDYLSHEDLKHSRWYFNEDKKRIFPSHLEWNLSYNSIYGDVVSAETYGGVLIPLSDTISNIYEKHNHYIFPPIISNSTHWGINYGSKIHIESTKTDAYSLEFIVAANSIYFLPAKEYRTFDLKNKPWTRYTHCFAEFGGTQQEIVILANELTLQCNVSPLFSLTSTAEVIFRNQMLNLSLGYSLYARAAEYIEILDTPPQLVLASSSPDVANNIINPSRSMGLRLEKEDTAITMSSLPSQQQYYASIIRQSDIDTDSATHPGILTGTFYLKGWLTPQENNNNGLGLGLSYNYSYHNTVIEYATIWFWGSIEF